MNSILKGYKKTNVGVIPDDWEVKKLGEIADIISGGTPKTTEKSFWNGTILWCTPTDITRTSGRYIESTEKTITDNGLKNSSAILLPINSLLLCSRATVGDVRIAKHEITTNQGFKSLVCNSSAYYLFIYYLIPFLKPKMLEKSYGSTFLEISKSNLASIQIQLPSYVEQKSIAEALSDMDALIEAQKELIAKKRDIKQGAMQDLLSGRVRLPGYETKGWKYTDIGDIPDDWRVKPLGILSKITTGHVDVNSGCREGIYPFFTCSRDITFSNSYTFDTEAILIAGNGDVGNMHYYVGKFEAYQRTYVVHSFNVHVPFILQYLKAYLLRRLQDGKIGSTIPYIVLNQLTNFLIFTPCLSEQQAIAEVLSDMDNEIETLEAELEKLNHMKRGMMQKLLTGRIRLI